MQSFRPLLILLGISLGTVTICQAVSPLDLHQVHFRNKVQDALQAVGTILNTTRHPVLLEEAEHHTYNDKYAMVDTMTNTLIASAISVLKKIGLSHETLLQLVKAVQEHKKPVSLHFRMDQTCDFVQQTKRKVIRSEMDIIGTVKSGAGLIGRLASSSKENIQVKATVQDYEWKLSTPYRVYFQIGDDQEIELQNRSDMETEIVLLGSLNKGRPTDRRPPTPLPSRVHDLTVDMTWLFQQIMSYGTTKGLLSSEFSVDRQSKACKTPRRNTEIEQAFAFRNKYEAWANEVSSIFEHLEKVAPADNDNRRPTTPEERQALESMMFAPILPLFEGSSVLPTGDIDLFLSKHDDSMDDFVHAVESRYPDEGYMSEKDIVLTSMLRHLGELTESWADSVDYVEGLLRDQLIQAIGKELTSQDFDRFMSHYSKQILTSEYAPKPFSYAIRRGGQFPDGTISIEGQAGEGSLVETMVRHIPGGDSNPPIALAVDAATSINLQGDRYLHGWVQHRWGLDHGSWETNLVARANQFSSFLVVLGVMSGPDTFVPKDAIIVQNKDEVLIPLLTNTLPSAKEFRDSISSLSPEQRAFAEAYRKMQLESSVFGVCIIQIKPQLETLLNLPEGALTKEIQLTQDLMTLFADHQIPSDLLSFDRSSNGNEDEGEPSVQEKVKTVRQYASTVLETLERAKDKELDDAKMRAKLQEAIDGRVEAYPNEEDSGGMHSSNRRHQQPRASLEMISAPAEHMPQMAFLSGQQMAAVPSTGSHESQPPSTTTFLPKRVDTSSSNDLTLIPSILDSKFEEMDKDGALKSTIVQTSKYWERSRQEHLLMGWEQNQRTLLDSDELTMERNKAMDLLVAISRSGSLPIKCCELHILVAVSHCFEKQIMETIIQDNINPIEKVTDSLSMIAAVIHNANNTSSIGGKQEESKSTIED